MAPALVRRVGIAGRPRGAGDAEGRDPSPPPLKPLAEPLTKDTAISARTAVGSHTQGHLSSPLPEQNHPETMSWGLGEHCWDHPREGGSEQRVRDDESNLLHLENGKRRKYISFKAKGGGGGGKL